MINRVLQAIGHPVMKLVMKKFPFSLFVLILGLLPIFAKAETSPKLVETGLRAEGNCFCQDIDIFGKKKKKKFKTVAAGLVIGGPVGVGGRIVFRPSRLAVVGDIAYNRLRSDAGQMTSAIVTKTDLRLYGKGLLGKLLRPYIFGGVMMQRGAFEEGKTQSVFLADTGVGGGIKLWRLEVNAEAGLLVPFKQIEAYRPGLNVFANVGILIWII